MAGQTIQKIKIGLEEHPIDAVYLSGASLSSSVTNSSDKIPTSAAVVSYVSNVTSTFASKGYVDTEISSAIEALPEPMIFKGTVGSGGTVTWTNLASAAAGNEGWTYKVITAHTADTKCPACKVGDTIISNGSSWVVIPSGDEPSGTVTNVSVSAGDGISVSGSPITSSGTITVSHKDTSSQANTANSGRTYIQNISVDTFGHVTNITSATETVTNTDYQTTLSGHYAPEGGSAASTSAGSDVNWAGSVITGITIDSKGHVTKATTGKIPSNPNTDYKTTYSGHYAPETSSTISASATGATATWGIDVVKAVYVSKDDKGHITGLSVTSGKIPSNPNTYRPVQVNGSQILANNGTATSLNISAGSGMSITGTTGGVVTISHDDTSSLSNTANTGRTYIQNISVDSYGHITGVTAATETVTNTDTKVTTAGNHYSPSTSSTTSASASGATASWDIDVVKAVYISQDNKGHITGLSVASGKIPSNPNTDYQTTYSGHYTPETSATISAAATGATAAWGIDVVKAVYLSKDNKGHITGLSVTSGKLPSNPNTNRPIKVNGTQILANSTTTSLDITAGAGMSITGTTGGVVTISHDDTSSLSNTANTGRTYIQNISVDSYGHITGVTAATETVTNSDSRVTSAGNHYSPSTSSTTVATASGATASWDIDVVKAVYISQDNKGHITGLSVTSGKIPSNPNTDTKVTSAANHYAPVSVSGSKITANATGATAAWSIDVVKGVTLERDDKGHVTNLTVTSGKIPGNPNTYRPIQVNGTQILANNSTATSLNISAGTNMSITGTTGGVVTISADLSGYATESYVDTAISNLPEPMLFKGTVGTSGTVTWANLASAAAANEGWTYKVITAHTADTKCPACKVGDTIISNGTEWVVIPSGDEPSGTVTNVSISGGSGISVTGSPITSSGTITVSHKDTSSQANTANTGRTYIQNISVDEFGHVTNITSASETVTNTDYQATYSGHYTPATSTTISASASGATAAWSIDVVKAVYLSKDNKGHITGLSVESGKIPANPNTDTKVTTAANHYSPTTSDTLSASATGATAAWEIDVVKAVYVSKDNRGHITGLSVTSGKLPANPNTDTKVTSAANHYEPATLSTSTLTANATGATAAWNIDVVKGVTLSRDSRGHVTGLAVTSGKIPANPNTDTKVTSAANHYDPVAVSTSKITANATGATAAWNIDVVKGVTVERDDKGHITNLTVTSGKIPANPNTDTKVTSAANHYTPTAVSASTITVTPTGTTSIGWSGKVVTGVTLSRDDKGHVTGLTIASGAIPANPNAYRPIQVNGTQILANNVATSLNLKNGTGISITNDGGAVTISNTVTNTDTKVTSADNHYTPTTSDTLSATATGATAAWGIDVVKAVYLSKDNKGHITGLSVTSGKIPGNPNTNTFRPVQVNGSQILANNSTATSLNIFAGSGMSITGTTGGVVTISHDDTSSLANTANTGRTYIQNISVDTYGHITGVTTATETVTNSDSKVTSAGNHYSPSTSSTTVATATGATAAWGIDVVKAVYISQDNRGHITGLSVTSGKIPSNPNTYRPVQVNGTQILGNNSTATSLNISAGTNMSITGTTGGVVTISANLSGYATESYVDTAISNLPEPMIFKGTVGTSGTVTWANLASAAAANEGWTYKVITAHTADTKCPACKVGDTIISNGSAWVVIPSGDEPSGTVTNVSISAGDGISVTGSPITSSGTITVSHKDTSTLANTSNSGRTYIQNISVDTYGHITGVTTATETVTNTDTKVTSAGNHYSPTTSDTLSATATGATAAWDIDVVKAVYVSKDNKGHITGLSVTSGKLPSNPNTDTKVTSAANHYSPSTSSTTSATATGATAAWGIDVVKAVYISQDNKGHITGLSVTSGKIPANPNTYRPIQVNGTQILANNSTATSLNIKAGSNISITGTTGGVVTISTTGLATTDHSHATSLTSGGTATVNLAANTSYTLTAGGNSVIFKTPADTDTKNTAGSTDTSSKIYLIGATSQATNPQTYSDNEVYATSGVLTTKSVQVGVGAATMEYDSTNSCIKFVFN